MSESEKGEVIDARASTSPKETPSKRRRLPLQKGRKVISRKKGNNEDNDTTSLRRSSRLPSLDGLPVKDQVAFEAKNLDGREAERKGKSLYKPSFTTKVIHRTWFLEDKPKDSGSTIFAVDRSTVRHPATTFCTAVEV